LKGGIIIKKVITAIGSNSLNINLRDDENFEIIGNDIPYQDGVLDILKGNSEINILILSESLIGEYEIKSFLEKIFEISKEIEIIFIMENENNNLRKILEKRGISKIFIEDDFEIQDIVNQILEKKTNPNVNFEIEELKKIVSKKQNKMFSKESRVIAISGNYGSGKSLITSLLGKSANRVGKKTVIIDFDIINNSINTIFRIKKYKVYENKGDIECFITHISSNLDVFCGIDALFTEENKISFEKVETLISDLKDIYDLILIDTSSETSLKFMKIVLANVDKIIFLLEPNLLEIKKAESLLEIYVEDWEIHPKKIEILLNKVNVNSVDQEIVKEIFGSFKIIGKINFSFKFTELANNIREGDLGLKKYIKILEKVS